VITVDGLRQEITNLEQQRQQAAETFQQATGALSLAHALLARLESDDGMPLQEFAESIGGNGATATIFPIEEKHGATN